MTAIYLFEFSNGKKYVGQTSIGIDRRLAAHRRESEKDVPKLAVHKAWKKYGQPKVTVIAIVEKQNANEIEIRAIKVFDSFGSNGYNLTPGGEASPMLVPETVEKVRQMALTPERIARNKEVHVGSKRSEESRKRMSAWQKGKPKKPFSDEHKKRIGQSNKGKAKNLGSKRTDETKAKMSAANKLRFEKAKIENNGNCISEETRRKMSEAQKKRYAKKN